MTRIATIIAAVSDLTGVDPSVITGPSRMGWTVMLRQAVCLVARETGRSYPQIGIALNRDHSSVMAARTAAMLRCGQDAGYAAFVERIRAAVR